MDPVYYTQNPFSLSQYYVMIIRFHTNRVNILQHGTKKFTRNNVSLICLQDSDPSLSVICASIAFPSRL